MPSPFRIIPISPADADRLRAGGGPVYTADSHPGYPCRQCLRDAEVGEELVLVSFDPFGADSPYRCASPIFLHREPCGEPVARTEADPLPEQLTRRQLSVRAFDAVAMMTDGVVIDGSALADTIERMLADATTARIHVHNAGRGCWATTIEPVVTECV